jgi:hypothetical protein
LATFGEVELYPIDFDKAVALFHSLIKSHPFMDGTKRTAFAAVVYFLHERGYTLQRPFLILLDKANEENFRYNLPRKFVTTQPPIPSF